MADDILVRAVESGDYAAWRPLWDGYNRVYGRHGAGALPEGITEATWRRFFAREERVHALVALQDGRVIGIAHYLFHRGTTRLNDVCHLRGGALRQAGRASGIHRLCA